jgi:hypothetical protein
MEARKPSTVLLTMLAYVVCTFAVQGASHFAINADHYAAMSFLRAKPVIPLGVAAMLIQGALFAWLFPTFNRTGNAVRNGLVFSWALGGFLAAYMVFALAGEYAVPSIPAWIGVEGSVAAVQYTVFGVLLGLLHRKKETA